MGARSFESDLRRRLLAFVVPTMIGVAIASVAVTWRALGAADDASARFKATTLLVALDTELAEGDEPRAAAGEVLHELEAEGARGSLRGGAVGATMTTTDAPQPEMDQLAVGACAYVRRDGDAWRGCRVTRGPYEAVAALRVTAHVDVVRTLAEAMGAIVLLALAATVVAARLTMRRPIADVRGLAEWSERVLAPDERAPPTPVLATEELTRLAASLDALVARLTTALSRERTTSAQIAHELRTPLTSMRAELEALGGERGARLVGDVDRLARAIDAVLLLASPPSAGETGEVVNVADVARALAPPGTTVEAPDEALVEANERLVELALTNLLENARVHGGREASVIRVTRVARGVRLAVIDEGGGVEAEMLARIFDPHVRGATSKGSGLGLALVRTVALRYGGEVDAAPSASGKGLEVGMTFGRALGWH